MPVAALYVTSEFAFAAAVIAAVMDAWSAGLVVLSVKFNWTLTISPAPNCPDSETVYCAVAPSSAEVVPVIDQRAGPSAGPSGPWVSSITVVTSSAVVSMLTAAPVDVAALVKASVKSSGPSMNASLVIPRSITRSVIDAPSDGAS